MQKPEEKAQRMLGNNRDKDPELRFPVSTGCTVMQTSGKPLPFTSHDAMSPGTRRSCSCL